MHIAHGVRQLNIGSEINLVRGRCFTIAGADLSQVKQTLQTSLEEGWFSVQSQQISQTTELIVGNQRTPWYSVLLFALPQRYIFEIRSDQDDSCIHLKYDERIAPWYLTILVAFAMMMSPWWFGSLAMLFRLTTAPTQLQDFHAMQIWISGIAGIFFVRMMLASGAGSTQALLENFRFRIRRLGAHVDQEQSGTITIKNLISLLFLLYIIAIVFLALISIPSLVSSLVPSNTTNSILATGAIGLLLVFGFAIIKGTMQTVKPIGGEERFAMIATGLSVQFGVVCILFAQLNFLLIGQTTDEIWAKFFQMARYMTMDEGQVQAVGLDHLTRVNYEIGYNLLHALGHPLLFAVAAPTSIGLVIILRSIRLAPHTRRMCERIHLDIESDYGRAAASGDVFRNKSSRSFLFAWILLAGVMAVGLFGLLRLGISCFEFGYAGRMPSSPIGAVDATGNVINFMVGMKERAYAGPIISRAFFLSWATVILLPVLVSLIGGLLTSWRRRCQLVALSESLPKEAAALNEAFREMASSAGLNVCLAISPGSQPSAAAHAVGILGWRKFVEVSARCLDILDTAEQKALVAHELGHHLRGHCWKHNIMQRLGGLTYVGSTFATSMENSYGFEMEADRAAIEKLGVDPTALRKCLMKMRADAIVQRLGKSTAGLGAIGDSDLESRFDSPRPIKFPGWKVALRDWYALVRPGAEIAYWHPSVVDRIRALEEDQDKETAI